MKLFIINCGFYENDNSFTFSESHCQFYCIAESAQMAKQRTNALNQFQIKNMHIDSIFEIQQIDGYKIQPIKVSNPMICDQSDESNLTTLNQIRHYQFNEVRSL